MERVYLTAFSEETDPPDWDESSLPDPLAALGDAGLRTATLVIAHLGAGWTTELPENHYRSGAGPLEALRDAADAIAGGHFDAVLITGVERLRTGYTREERHRLMAIYDGHTIPEAYELVTRAWCELNRVGPAEFTALADALYENNRLVAGVEDLADPKWLIPLTPSQRGIDCANPLIDWRGQLVVANRKALKRLDSPAALLEGVGYARLAADGPANAREIASFDHLASAIDQAEKAASKKVGQLLSDPTTAPEVYTCYPVVPLAFLNKAGLGSNAGELLETLRRVPITVTGGMNFARAPWNLPALRGLVRVGSLVGAGEARAGIVHANGGAGYAQGVALLGLA